MSNLFRQQTINHSYKLLEIVHIIGHNKNLSTTTIIYFWIRISLASYQMTSSYIARTPIAVLQMIPPSVPRDEDMATWTPPPKPLKSFTRQLIIIFAITPLSNPSNNGSPLLSSTYIFRPGLYPRFSSRHHPPAPTGLVGAPLGLLTCTSGRLLLFPDTFHLPNSNNFRPSFFFKQVRPPTSTHY